MLFFIWAVPQDLSNIISRTFCTCSCQSAPSRRCLKFHHVCCVSLCMFKSSVYSKREVCKDVRTKFLIFSVVLRKIDYLIKDKIIIIKTYTLFMFKKSEIIEVILNIKYVCFPNGQCHAQRNKKVKCVNLKNDY